MIIANSVFALIYLSTGKKLAQNLGTSMISIIALIIMGVANVVFAAMLLSWEKKWLLWFCDNWVTYIFLKYKYWLISGTLRWFVWYCNLYGILQIKKRRCFCLGKFGIKYPIKGFGHLILLGILQIKKNGFSHGSILNKQQRVKSIHTKQIYRLIFSFIFKIS